MSQLHTVIVKPMETEKSHVGLQQGKYTFKVRRNATKTAIIAAIKQYYGIEVKSVRTAIMHPKTRAAGKGKAVTKRVLYKKAIVTTVGAKPIDVNKIKV